VGVALALGPAVGLTKIDSALITTNRRVLLVVTITVTDLTITATLAMPLGKTRSRNPLRCSNLATGTVDMGLPNLTARPTSTTTMARLQPLRVVRMVVVVVFVVVVVAVVAVAVVAVAVVATVRADVIVAVALTIVVDVTPSHGALVITIMVLAMTVVPVCLLQVATTALAVTIPLSGRSVKALVVATSASMGHRLVLHPCQSCRTCGVVIECHCLPVPSCCLMQLVAESSSCPMQRMLGGPWPRT
jgi:hypothetical protein